MKHVVWTLVVLLAMPLPIFGQEKQDEIDKLKAEIRSLKLVNELKQKRNDVQLDKLKDALDKVEDFANKLKRASQEKTTAITELQYARQEAERLKKDLSELEANHVDLARELKELKEKLAKAPVPRKAILGKVTAVANDISLVVISVGKDDDVLVGDEFTIYRGGVKAGEFVAKIVIDRVDRKWSSGRVALKKKDPRVGDDVSNHIFVSRDKIKDPVMKGAEQHYQRGREKYWQKKYEEALRDLERALELDPKDMRAKALIDEIKARQNKKSKSLDKGSADALAEIRKELDEIRREIRKLSDKMLPSWQKFGLAVDNLSKDLLGHFGVKSGVIVRKVEKGSVAEKAGLQKYDIVPGMTKDGFLKALEKRKGFAVIRHGKRIQFTEYRR